MRRIFATLLLLTLTGCPSLGSGFEPGNLFAATRPGDYLTAKDYEKLVVEILAVEGAATYGSAEVIDSAKMLCNKPAGVEAVWSPVIPHVAAPAQTWSKSDLLTLRARWAKRKTAANTVALTVLFVHGSFEENPTTTCGVVFASDLICVFPDLGAAGSEVTVHEFGHIMGLVNNGTPSITKHEDPNSSGHCQNQGTCIMYYDNRLAGSVFCPACLRDLRGK